MSYKTIVVHLDASRQRAQKLEAAFEQAGKFDAHLVGLYAPGPLAIPSRVLAEIGPAGIELLGRNRILAAQAAQEYGIQLQAAKLPDVKRGFVLLPRRWV